MGLADLLDEQHDELMRRWRSRAGKKLGVSALDSPELDDDLPRFLLELVHNLRRAEDGGGGEPETPSATDHGAQRLDIGFDVQEIVREYGILHLSIIDLAADAQQPITSREDRVLVRVFSTAVATAVAEYQRLRQLEIEHQASEHLAFVAHELRNPLQTARLSFALLRRRELTAGGPRVDRVDHALARINELIDFSLTESRLKHAARPTYEPIAIGLLLRELMEDAAEHAEDRGVTLHTESNAAEDTLEADPRLLQSALANLIRNAIKFTPPHGSVIVRARTLVAGRVAFDVEDECGGLAEGKMESLFDPFVQNGRDRSGFGLGLAIARQAIEAQHGTIHVRNLPGKGCQFTIDLPLRAVAVAEDGERALPPG